jgi:2-polyprenyl-3-methyl-5-hydroxy-6-metoxy-1,4-benzoquinol methylase
VLPRQLEINALEASSDRTRGRDDYSRMQKQEYSGLVRDVYTAKAAVSPYFDRAVEHGCNTRALMLAELAARRARFDELAGGLRDRLARLAARHGDFRLLDFGCGVGRLMAPLEEDGFKVDGIDVCENMIAMARSLPLLSACSLFLTDGLG